nr:unnamed protein product [Spirometra erinaceieuropaei]
MGHFGHMRIHESGLDRTPIKPTKSNTSTVHTPNLVPSVRDTTTTASSSVSDTDTTESHAHSPHALAWSVTCESIAQKLANQCQEHPPIPTNFPHCPRAFRHRMSLFGHMRFHDDLR